MKHASIVLWQGLKAEGEGLVFVRAVKIQQRRASFPVAHGVQVGILSRGEDLLFQHEAEKTVADTGDALEERLCITFSYKGKG